MWDNIKELLTSKKFKVLIFSILGLVCSVVADKLSVTEAIDAAWPLVLAYFGAQGLSDAFGKGKIEGEAKVAETTKTTTKKK